MNKPAFKRARTPEAKAARRNAILAAAADLLAREGLDGTTLNAIANEAGVVKSNIYRYFESREEILMRLLTDDLHAFQQTLAARVCEPKAIEETTGIVSQSLADAPRLCLLISIVASTLERNISTKTLREIKSDMLSTGEQAAVTLRLAMPELTAEQAGSAVQILFTLIAGLWPMSTPGPALQALYKEPEFAQYNHDFEQVLRMSVQIMFKGLAT